MLNKNGERMLAYVEKINDIIPIEGADNIESVQINSWNVITKKGEFKIGDKCVFFEIDSKLPETEWSEFMRSKNFKVKTMKLNKFRVISQGLALPLSIVNLPIDLELHTDLTQKLNVTYSIKEDNTRKANKLKIKYQPVNKIIKFLHTIPIVKNIIEKYGTKYISKLKHFPTDRFIGLQRSDQERIENFCWDVLVKNDFRYYETLKIDGTSATYVLERTLFGYEFYVCSRNVRQLNSKQECYFSDNVYWEVARKFNIKKMLKDYMDRYDLKWVALQGEICGESENGIAIQGNPHKLKGLHFYGFDMYNSKVKGKMDIVDAAIWCGKYDINWVPVLGVIKLSHFKDFKDFKEHADGPCCLVGSSGLREGFVYRCVNYPNFSFKNVSVEYLLKRGE